MSCMSPSQCADLSQITPAPTAQAPPLPRHGQAPSACINLVHPGGGKKIQQLPMTSHPASSVPGVLLIPRSCGCLGPFPLTPSAYLSCRGRRGSEGQNCSGVQRTWGFQKKAALSHRHLAVKWEDPPLQQTWQPRLLRYDEAWVSAVERTENV